MLNQAIVAAFIANSASAFGIGGVPLTRTQAVEPGKASWTGPATPAAGSALFAALVKASDQSLSHD